MRFLTLFSSSSFFLLSKEEVILSCNLQEPRRTTHLLSSPNKSSTSIHHTKVAFPYKRVSEVIKSFEFEFKKRFSLLLIQNICQQKKCAFRINLKKKKVADWNFLTNYICIIYLNNHRSSPIINKLQMPQPGTSHLNTKTKAQTQHKLDYQLCK